MGMDRSSAKRSLGPVTGGWLKFLLEDLDMDLQTFEALPPEIRAVLRESGPTGRKSRRESVGLSDRWREEELRRDGAALSRTLEGADQGPFQTDFSDFLENLGDLDRAIIERLMGGRSIEDTGRDLGLRAADVCAAIERARGKYGM